MNIVRPSPVTEFVWPLRVYYEDTDSGGVVYYANYLKFMERARTEWLRALGVEQDVLRAQRGVIFAVRSVSAEYLKPARFNDALHVTAHVAATSKVSVTFAQRVLRVAQDANEDDVVLCTADIKIVCLDANSFRPCGVPEELRAEIERER